MDKVENAIRKTTRYADKYGQKLSDRQLFLRLISAKRYPFLSLRGKGVKEIGRGEWQNKVKKAEVFVEEYLGKIKGILMVGISGSVAAESAKAWEDIDFLIITKSDELWWWRLYLRVIVWWHKIPHRKFNKKEKRDEFCFNLWLDENNLSIPKSKRNLKNATDLIMMKVIWDKDNTYRKFLRKNTWVKKYLATGYGERLQMSKRIDGKIGGKKRKYFLKILNKILFGGQYFYMFLKGNKEIDFDNINEGQAFFHENR